ncbi:hypothetical protein CHS0354_035716, partial [Potamilus streckersoni]
TLSVAVSVFTLCAISVERYFAICHPLRMRFTAVVMWISISVIWGMGTLVGLPELLYQRLGRTYPSHFTEYLTFCTLDLEPDDKKAYQMFLMTGLYGFPMCLMFFAYSVIGVRLCRNSFPGIQEAENGHK